MGNVLNAAPAYRITCTSSGIWRRYLYESGQMYADFTSHTTVGNWPLVSVAYGRSPESGKLGTARGIVAVGRKAIGVIAVGQLVAGMEGYAQAGFGPETLHTAHRWHF